MKIGWPVVIALVVAMGSARLSSVQVITPAPDRPPMTGKEELRGASPEIEDLVREALEDRFKAGDIPDLNLLNGRSHVLVLKEMPRARLQVSDRALPKINGTQFELIGADEASERAERSRKDVVYLTVNDPQIDGATAFLWLGTDLAMPSKPGVLKMCCCTGRAEFRRAEGRWVFVKWRGMRCV